MPIGRKAGMLRLYGVTTYCALSRGFTIGRKPLVDAFVLLPSRKPAKARHCQNSSFQIWKVHSHPDFSYALCHCTLLSFARWGCKSMSMATDAQHSSSSPRFARLKLTRFSLYGKNARYLGLSNTGRWISKCVSSAFVASPCGEKAKSFRHLNCTTLPPSDGTVSAKKGPVESSFSAGSE